MTSARALIVIPCLNEAKHLPGLLGQLLAETETKGHLVVVADGGSTDGSCDIVLQLINHHPNLRLMHNAQRLQSAGINAAVCSFGLGHDYLIRVDAHAHYPPDYIDRLMIAAAERDAGAVVVPLVTIARDCFQQAVAVAQNSVIGTGGAAHRMGGASGWVDHGHHALMAMSDFAAVGGYDARFSHNEDAELDVRLRVSGVRIWLEATLAIEYLPRNRPLALLRQYHNYGRGRARTAKLHGTGLKSRQMLPLLVPPAIIAAILTPFALMLGPALLILAIPSTIWMLACGVGGGIAARAAGGGGCAYAAGLAAMIMHMGWSSGFIREWLFSPALTSPTSLSLDLLENAR